MFKNKNIYKIVICTLLIGFSFIPIGAHAKETNITENLMKFLPRLSFELVEKDIQKFTDETPAIINTEPIENVESYLPEKIYPKSIYTSELLEKITPRADTFTVIDIETKKVFKAKRYGGNKHLDAEPATYTDSKVLNSINGKSWDRRPIILYLDEEYYAASMHTMPHGNGFIQNNGYDGHFCIHVLGSKTHGGNKSCEKHQRCISQAMKTEIGEIVNTISPTE